MGRKYSTPCHYAINQHSPCGIRREVTTDDNYYYKRNWSTAHENIDCVPCLKWFKEKRLKEVASIERKISQLEFPKDHVPEGSS